MSFVVDFVRPRRPIMKNNPPWAARSNFNDRILVSKRVGCFTFNSIYSVDLAALCLK